MATAELQVGDVVRLKSGGPAMTIARQHDGACPSVFECLYYDGGKIKAAVCPPATLERVEPTPVNEMSGYIRRCYEQGGFTDPPDPDVEVLVEGVDPKP
jgi:uncharacterized protein YodC (DUF2158 family)